MRQPGFLHLTGRAMWRQCDHAGTRIEGRPARVTLATAVSVRGDGDALPAVDLAPWRDVMGGAARIACPPDLCTGEALLMADPTLGLLVWQGGAWVVLALPPISAAVGGPLDFQPATPPAPPVPPRSLAVDPAGRLWLLDVAPPALRVLGPELSLAARLMLPAESAPFAVACTRWGLLVADDAAPRILVLPWGGAWRAWTLPAAPLALAGDSSFGLAIAILDGRRVAVFRGADAPVVFDLPAVQAPLHAVVTGPSSVVFADLGAVPGAPQVTSFTTFEVTAEGLEAGAGLAVRGFDGRALWQAADGRLHASTAGGMRPLYAREPSLTTRGTVETFALDSNVFACVWHRVFVDACVPPGTRITLETRTGDTLPPKDLRRAPRPPADVALAPAIDENWPPLGTLEVEEAVGWSAVGLLDRRPAFADVPLQPFVNALPSEDRLRAARGETAPPPEAMVTLESVVKAPPGRWLWLRLRLQGTERRAPAVFAVRVTCPRPSLMDLLPAYWRADPVAADATDRALALFEGFTTETDARISAIRHLVSAETTPPEALDWLASFLALTFDQRVDEAVRRSLLQEAATLWRQRGTVPGLNRLLSILARAPVQIIEGFRLRRTSAAVIGDAAWGVLGPGLQLGDDEGSEAVPGEPWAAALASKHAALTLRRAAQEAAGETSCPPADPPYPLDPDPLIAFHRRFAHRFTVVIPAHRTDALEAVLDLATETHKPAHTIHRLCWLDAGFRLGDGSLVGIARLGPRPGFAPAILDDRAPLGAGRTLGLATHDDRWRVGATRTRGTLRS